ncbi:MAG: hypothetical protein HY424_00950 [Candidatus Levybacteria bacterium]|nr:hypothetical protein [Candidatus Levybacteria bacterium]
MTFLMQSLVIVASFLAVYLWQKSSFSAFTIPLLALLVVVYLILARKKNLRFFFLNSIILLLVFSTGEISSPLFFLLYFLSFGIAFLFDPQVVFVFTAGLILLFFPSSLKTDLTKNLILLFSLVFLSPIAFFLGKTYQENQANKKKIEAMKKKAEETEDLWLMI